jgi:hypothetical protein
MRAGNTHEEENVPISNREIKYDVAIFVLVAACDMAVEC